MGGPEGKEKENGGGGGGGEGAAGEAEEAEVEAASTEREDNAIMRVSDTDDSWLPLYSNTVTRCAGWDTLLYMVG